MFSMCNRFGVAAAAVLVIGSAGQAGASTITLATCANPPGPGCNGLTGAVTVDLASSAPGLRTGDLAITVANGTNGFLNDLKLVYTGVLPSWDKKAKAREARVYDLDPTRGDAVGIGSITAAFDTDGSGGMILNLAIDFPQPNGDRLDSGESVSFGLSAEDFDLSDSFSVSDALAQVNEVGTTGSSARLRPGASTTDTGRNDAEPVPEPASLVLLGTGLLGFAGRLRARIRQ